MRIRRKASPWLLLLQDLGLVAVSVFVAIALMKTDVLVGVLTSTKELEYLGSFLAGLFFTSIFTTAPAIVTLGEIAQANGVWPTAALGALGAVVGDLLIFRFVRDSLTEHVAALVKARGRGRKSSVSRGRLLRWLAFMVGGLVIASPLPDELGVSLLGMSKVRMAVFVPVALVFNFLGIAAIGFVAISL